MRDSGVDRPVSYRIQSKSSSIPVRADCLREVPDYSAARSFPSISRCQTPYSTDVAQTLSPMNRANSGYGKLAFPNSETQEADFKCAASFLFHGLQISYYGMLSLNCRGTVPRSGRLIHKSDHPLVIEFDL